MPDQQLLRIARERLGEVVAHELGRIPDRRRQGHFASRLALDRALHLTGSEIAENVAYLRYSGDGRPVLVSRAGREVHGVGCSLAHTGRAGLAVIGPSDVGADVEPQHRFGLEFAFRISEPDEFDLVSEAGISPDLLPAAIWTAKESVLKATGRGMRIDPRHIRIVGRIAGGWRLYVEGGRNVPRNWDVASYGAAGYRLAIARSAGSGPVALYLHLSQPRYRGAEVPG
ncbi:MAG: 4'-phosphopantetheinyl transferase superfamily protein [marine benthic group bacterium]|nr:4'-phosphopantetheinyl transferase superfamily protein [Gemmatimonadota bacterium]